MPQVSLGSAEAKFNEAISADSSTKIILHAVKGAAHSWTQKYTSDLNRLFHVVATFYYLNKQIEVQVVRGD